MFDLQLLLDHFHIYLFNFFFLISQFLRSIINGFFQLQIIGLQFFSAVIILRANNCLCRKRAVNADVASRRATAVAAARC